MSIAQSILAEYEQEAATTRTLLERVPEDKFDWRPHDKSMSLARLAGHIAESPEWVGAIMDEEEIDFAAEVDYSTSTPESGEQLLETFDRAVSAFCEKMAGYSDEDFMVTWTMKKGDQVLGQMPRVAVVRMFVLNHHYHHRGQLTVYLRLLGVPLPMVYGPTADEQGPLGD